jgi:PPOX class probable F420-dependent enzyme
LPLPGRDPDNFTTVSLRTSYDAVRPFLNQPLRAVLATTSPDGSPHAVVLDYLAIDGALLLNGRAGRRWVTNLQHDPRATALIHDPADVGHWVSIAGAVQLLREGDEASVEDAKIMSRRYGDDPEQFNGQHRVSWHLIPGRVLERTE